MNAGRRRLFRSTLLVAAIILAGCSADEPPPPAVVADSQPKILSNLNDVAATPVNPLAIDQVPQRGEGMILDHGPVSAGPRTFQTEPGWSREVGSDANPATVRVLNAKAAKFGNFSAVILNRILARLLVEERSEEFSRGKLPDELKAVIIIATLNKQGKLTELVLEQHSGKAKIDQMMLEVCKKSIWYENPPAAALSDDGTYKLTIKLKLDNYASLDDTHWSFVTDLGLGIS
jgi:hypothetical protein